MCYPKLIWRRCREKVGRLAATGLLPAVLGFQLVTAAPVHASSVESGQRLARVHCSGCHSIDKTSKSPLAKAPPFRTLNQRYPVESLQEALAEGIVTGHPEMPEFRFKPTEVGDFIAFLKSLE